MLLMENFPTMATVNISPYFAKIQLKSVLFPQAIFAENNIFISTV